MAIADTITSMQTHTSNAYTMIGYGTDLTGINKNLENLSTSIFNAFLEALRTPDTLFTNLPKKSGTGANITLNDTANAPMRIELGASELTQDGTPTPSTPQDIHTISGSNTIKVEGSQLFNVDDLVKVDNKILNDSGNEVNDSTGGYTKMYIPAIPSTQYTISGLSSSGGKRIYYFDKSKTFISRTSTYSDTSTATFTTPNNCYYIDIQYYISGNNFNNYMLNLGSTALPYEPHVSQEADIDLSSKNLLSLKNLQKSGWNLYFDNPMKEAGDYTISCESEIYVNPTAQGFALAFQNEIGGSDIGSYFTGYSFGRESRETSKTITQEQAEAKYIVLKPNGEGLSPSAIREAKTMLNKGNAKIPYVEYYEPIEYSKTGNYEDKFIRTSGKNLFDVSKYQNLSTTYEYNLNNYHIKKIQLEPNTDYTISHNASSSSSVVILMNNVQQVNSSGYYDLRNASGSKTFTTDSTGCLYIGVLYTASDTDYNDRINSCNLVINKGSTALDYEPYGSNEWYIKKKPYKVVLDGTENWIYDTAGGFNRFSTLLQDAFVGTGRQICLSNYFVNNLSSNADGICFIANKYLYLYKNDITTASDFKTWLSTHNTIVYYILSTPTYTQITGTLAEQLENVYQKMLSQAGQTNISQVNNGLAFNMSVQAIEE